MSTMNKRVQEGDNTQVALDRMRYTKDTASSRLVLLAIVFDVLYFVSIYKSDVGAFYYQALIGASIIYNLIFMLAAFLAEEAVKTRKGGYTVPLVVLGAVQILRIFILPMQAHAAQVTIAGVNSAVMGDGQFIRVIIYLVLSAACCVFAGINSNAQCKKLNGYLESLKQSEGGAV